MGLIDLAAQLATFSISFTSWSRRLRAYVCSNREFSTSTDTGRILVTALGTVAEMERRFILERQRAGIDAAKKKGVYKGRKPSVPVEQVRRMHGEGRGPAEIAAALGVSRMSVWRALKDRVHA